MRTRSLVPWVAVRVVLVALCAAALLASVRAQGAWSAQETQLVKTPATYAITDEDKTANVVRESCVLNAWPSQPSRTVNISPLSNDPRVVSMTDWGWNDACPYQDIDGDGLTDFVFHINLHSLYDIGTWELVCDGYTVRPNQQITDSRGQVFSCCYADKNNPCGWNCYAECVTPFANPFTITSTYTTTRRP